MYRSSGRALLLMTLWVCSAVLLVVCADIAMPKASDFSSVAEKEKSAAVSAVLTSSDMSSPANTDYSLDSSEYIVQLTDEELDLLARVISAEARGESYDGQVAVGAVILNRVACEDFPDSVTDVCHQPGAFCGIADGQVNIEPSQSCRDAAEAAARGEDPTGGAVYFYNPKTAASDWIRSRPVVVIIGNHYFCV